MRSLTTLVMATALLSFSTACAEQKGKPKDDKKEDKKDEKKDEKK